jgi:hypothetical protein
VLRLAHSSCIHAFCWQLAWLAAETAAQSAVVTGAAVAAISRGLLELTSLCLSGCSCIQNDVTMQVRSLTDGPLMGTAHGLLVQKMPWLERLSLYDCDMITPASFLTMFQACPQLWVTAAVTCALRLSTKLPGRSTWQCPDMQNHPADNACILRGRVDRCALLEATTRALPALIRSKRAAPATPAGAPAPAGYAGDIVLMLQDGEGGSR